MSKESRTKFVEIGPRSDRDTIRRYFSIVDEQQVEHVVGGTKLDTFFVSWPTQLTIDEFLARASDTIDKILRKNPPPRPSSNHSGIAIMTPGASSAPASYSGFGINWVNIGETGIGDEDLPFSELGWPLNIANIKKIVCKKGGSVTNENPDETFIRVEGSPCSIHFNGDRWPRSFSYWSHIYPPEELLELYSQTNLGVVSPKFFDSSLREVLMPHITEGRYFLV